MTKCLYPAAHTKTLATKSTDTYAAHSVGMYGLRTRCQGLPLLPPYVQYIVWSAVCAQYSTEYSVVCDYGVYMYFIRYSVD